MGLVRRTPERVRASDRDRKAWELRVRGYSLQQIADELGYNSVQHVSVVIATRMREEKKRMSETIDAAMAVETERLEAQTRRIWPRVMEEPMRDPVTGAPYVDEKGNPIHWPFDPKAHRLALEIHDRRVRMLGLDKVRIEITGANGGPVQVANGGPAASLANLSPQELALLEHLHMKARGLSPDASDKAGEVVDGEVVSSVGASAEGDAVEGEGEGEGDDTDAIIAAEATANPAAPIVVPRPLENRGGIYRVRNTKSGKVYVGQSNKIAARCLQHAAKLRRGRHENEPLQAAWNADGPGAFVFEAVCYTDVNVDAIEQQTIDAVPMELRYNVNRVIPDE